MRDELWTRSAADLSPDHFVLQLNKRDLPDAMPVDEQKRDLRTAEITPPVIEAVAATGQGVFETLKAAVKPVVLAGRKRLVQA